MEIKVENSVVLVEVISELVKVGIQFKSAQLPNGEWVINLTGGY